MDHVDQESHYVLDLNLPDLALLRRMSMSITIDTISKATQRLLKAAPGQPEVEVLTEMWVSSDFFSDFHGDLVRLIEDSIKNNTDRVEFSVPRSYRDFIRDVVHHEPFDPDAPNASEVAKNLGLKPPEYRKAVKRLRHRLAEAPLLEGQRINVRGPSLAC